MGLKELRAKAMKQTREKVSEEKFKKDYLIVHAIEAIDELDEVHNLMLERLRNWYSLHYPELNKLVQNPETYLEIIKELKSRKNMVKSKLEHVTNKANKIELIAKESIGADIDDKDLEQIAKLAELILHIEQERRELVDYVDKETRQLMPNVHAILGGLLSARMLAKAHSLERMAMFPSSTVQLLGAEKALFAHIKTGVKPPKYGVLFAFGPIQRAPKNKKGKIARAVASKVSIAAKLDYFKHGYDENLVKSTEQKIGEILK